MFFIVKNNTIFDEFYIMAKGDLNLILVNMISNKSYAPQLFSNFNYTIHNS